MLATIASLSDEGLRDAREHYATLEARPKPHVLDDATIARTKRVNGESLEWCDVYDRQLARWQRERLTRAQREEVTRLQGMQRDLRKVLTQILELADELGRGRSNASSPRAISSWAWSSCWDRVTQRMRAARPVGNIGSAGVNRHGEGDERALHRRSSDPR